MSVAKPSPEIESDELGFHEVLSEVARQGVSQELGANRKALTLLSVLQQEHAPETVKADIAPFSLLTKLVDSHRGPLRQRLLDLKLDMIDFVENRIGINEDQESRKTKQRQYEEAVEGLFGAIGDVKAQEEYGLLNERLENAEEGEYSEERIALMERRKREWEKKSTIKL